MKGVGRGGTLTRRKLSQRKGCVFVIDKYVEDVKHDQKPVLDLLEPIIRPTDPVKEALQRILFKMSQYRPEIIKLRVSTFWMSGKSMDSRRRPPQPRRLVSFRQ